MASKFLDWIKQGVVAIVEPEREARIARNTAILHQQLVSQGRAFQIEKTGIQDKIPAGELEIVKERVFRHILTRAWADESVNVEEARTLNWVADALLLSAESVARLNGEFAKEAFERAFAESIADGTITDMEFARLNRIANSIQSSVPQLFRAYFRDSAHRLFGGIFASIVSDGVIAADEWSGMWKLAEQLGVARIELLSIIQPQATAFLEHVLVNAKADQIIDPHEEAMLNWMLQTFVLPKDVVAYVTGEVCSLKVLNDVRNGRLPSLPQPDGFGLRAGEIVHCITEARHKLTKSLKTGPRTETFDGRAVITDARLIFTSPQKSQSVNHRNILECIEHGVGVELRSSGKGTGIYLFADRPRLTTLMLRTAIGRANQTIVAKVDEPPGRHIPRDVRQRVWQAYGGRCADCKSDQYLEYDHVIPVAKGGSNHEGNVQLLCRRCNLTKSDHI